jgi:hypothetical protein
MWEPLAVTEGLRALNAERKKTASTDIRFCPSGGGALQKEGRCFRVPTRSDTM